MVKISSIVVDRELEGLRITKRVRERFPEAEVQIVEDGRELTAAVESRLNARTIGKSIVHLAKSRGELLKPCPGTDHYLCCGYYVLNSIENCSMECTYCILQHYLSDPVIRIHPETDNIFAQLEKLLKSDPKRLFRIGSGELSDSLLYDPITDFTLEVIPFLRSYPNVLFEFKTKTANVGNLLAIDPTPSNIVVGWTVNTPSVIASEEKKTAALPDRLEAARLCSSKGYKIAFHFDPIILYPDCVDEYCSVVDEIFRKVPARHIAWISMGMLRYPPELGHIIQKRFPKTRIVYGETVCGNDGKVRYFKKHRIRAFGEIYRRIHRYTRGEVFVYLCMESPEIWRKAIGFSPLDNEDFSTRFNLHLVDQFGL